MSENTKKYELTDDTIPNIWNGNKHVTLYRIRALRDIRPGVRAGDIGGYIESEENLSHVGEAWVYGKARVFDSALVSGSAQVSGKARVYDSAWVYGEAQVYGEALVSGSARIEATDHWLCIAANPTPNASQAMLTRQEEDYLLTVGCWTGTTDELRALADSDTWPSGGDADYRAKYAPVLHAIAALADARIATWDPRGPQY